MKIGRGFIYPKKEAERFLDDYLGEDLSTHEDLILAKVRHGKDNAKR